MRGPPAAFTLILTLLLLVAGLPAPSRAAGGTISGNVTFTVADPNFGTSLYSIVYSYPANVTEGTNLNVTLRLDVNELTGFKLYLIEYAISVTLFSPAGGSITRSVNSTSPYLYPGSHWGPIKVSLPVDVSKFNVQSGTSVLGNVSLALGTEVWWDAPYSFHYPESGSHNAGTVTIIGSQLQGPNYGAFYATVLVGGVAGVLATYAWDRLRRGDKLQDKLHPDIS